MEAAQSTLKMAQANVEGLLQNPYIMTLIKVTLVVYAAQFAPRLPDAAKKALDNTFVKMAGIAAIAYVSSKDLQLALLLAIAYVFTINLLAGRSPLESFAEFTKGKIDLSRLLEPKTVVYPGCSNIKLDDLVKAFDGDATKLQDTVRFAYLEMMKSDLSVDAKKRLEKYAKMAGLPYNIQINDENAPYIATLLMNYGFKFSDDCRAPN